MAGTTHTTDPTPDGEGTERFTFGLVLDVVKVLEDHCYPQFNGPAVVELQMHLLHLLHGSPDGYCTGRPRSRVDMDASIAEHRNVVSPTLDLQTTCQNRIHAA